MRKKLLGVFLVIFTVILVFPITSKALGWIQIDGNWYYEESEGVYKTGWFLDDNNNWYYFDSRGSMVTDLMHIEDDYYYMSTIDDLIGIRQTGWMKIDDDWYYFSPTTGAALRSTWLSWADNRYYFDSEGKMAKGLTEIVEDGVTNVYYFKDLPYSNGNENVTVHIHTQSDLDNYLNSTGKNLLGDRVFFENTLNIEFPKNEIYYLNYDSSSINSNKTYWYITSESTGNINFNNSTFLIGENNTLFLNSTGDHSNQEIANANFYGTVNNSIRADGSVSSKNGNFNADLIHASNMTFKNLIFKNCQDVSDHIFDVMGSDHITFNGVAIYGYFGDVSINDLDNASSLSNWTDHSLYAEAIQIDAFNNNSSGISNLNDNPIFNGLEVDGLASTYITITNSTFGPYNGASGQAIIDKTNDITVKSFGATVGSHAPDQVGDSKYSYLTIKDNAFINTISRTNTGNDRRLYPIHYEFGGLEGNDPSENETISTSDISNNIFVNLNPSAGYNIYLGVGDTIMGNFGNGDYDTTTTDENANSEVDNALVVKNGVQRYIYRSGANLLGLQTVGDNTYYFRTEDNEVSAGPKGSMLKDACVQIENVHYCFDSEGNLESMITSISKPTNSKCIPNLVYDGNTRNIIINPTDDIGIVWSNYEQTNAGDYTVTATLEDGFKWDDDTTEPVEITCSISRKKLEIPLMAVSTFNYSGNQITPIIDPFNLFLMDIEGNVSAIDAGTYSSTVSLKYPENYEWEDGSQSSIGFTWTINKVDYSAPTVTPYFDKYDGNEHSVIATGEGELEYSEDNILWTSEVPKYTNAGVYPVYVRVKKDDNHNASQVVESSVTINKIVVNYPTLAVTLYNYTGEEITPELTGVDTDLMTVSAETFGTNAGAYNIFVSLNDRVNTVWEDDSDSSYTIPWRIAKVSGDIPTVTPYNDKYDKQAHSIEAIGSGELEYSLDGENWSDTNPTKTNVGVYPVYVRTKGDENHNPSESVSSTITITKRSLIKPTMTTSNYLFTGSEINFSINFYNDNWSEWMEKAGTYTATTVGSYVAEVALIDSDNTEWNDHTIDNVSFDWHIVQSQSITPIITNYVGAYDGQPHSITVEQPSYGTIFYSTNYNVPGVDTVWSAVNPTRTNVGTTNVYVYIRGDANHTDSPVVMGSITITDAVPDYEINGYNVDEINKYILGINVGTTLEDFKNNIVIGDGYSVNVDTKTINGKQVLYTGGKTRIMQGNVIVAEFTNVVIGDVNGNGTIDIIDYIRIMKDIMDTEPLTGAYAKAADVNGNNQIDIIDYIRIMKIIMEEE